MAQGRVCVVGSINMDLVVQTPALPKPGETIIGGPFATFGGGKGANQAVAAARAGAPTTLIGCVGSDTYGITLRASLSHDLDMTEVVEREGVASGVALIAVAPDGQNTIIVASGANATLSVADVERARHAIADADVLLLQLEVPLEVSTHAATLARAAGTTVVLNPAPAQPLSDQLLAVVDILVPNETEAGLLTGVEPQDWDAAQAAADQLRGRGVPSVIVTLGSRGALVVTEGGAERVPAFAVAAIDATAAGDAFVGAFAVALAEGKSVPEAARWGSAAGALATTKSGAQPSLPSREAIEQLVVTQPAR
jgi:ribokinase